MFPHAIIKDMNVQNVTDVYFKNSVPGQGVLAYEEGYHMETHRKELEIGNWVHNTFGGDITFLKEASDCSRKTADYIWNGKAWELKSISSAKAADSAFRTAAKQIQNNPGGMILELTDEVEAAELEKVLFDRFRRVGIEKLDVLIMAKGTVIKILRYKK